VAMMSRRKVRDPGASVPPEKVTIAPALPDVCMREAIFRLLPERLGQR
jgi:hypothetical protein